MPRTQQHLQPGNDCISIQCSCINPRNAWHGIPLAPGREALLPFRLHFFPSSDIPHHDSEQLQSLRGYYHINRHMSWCVYHIAAVSTGVSGKENRWFQPKQNIQSCQKNSTFIWKENKTHAFANHSCHS